MDLRQEIRGVVKGMMRPEDCDDEIIEFYVDTFELMFKEFKNEL